MNRLEREAATTSCRMCAEMFDLEYVAPPEWEQGWEAACPDDILADREAALRRPVSTRAALTGLVGWFVPICFGIAMCFNAGLGKW